MISINKEKRKLIEEAVEYNEGLIEKADGDMDKIIDDLIIINHGEYSIWNPLMDPTLRFDINPEDEYTEDEINDFLNDYKNKVL
ncbi:MAG: hypothetical protein ACOCRX_11050 [Candidatus Woesearchaeota archaeon]